MGIPTSPLAMKLFMNLFTIFSQVRITFILVKLATNMIVSNIEYLFVLVLFKVYVT